MAVMLSDIATALRLPSTGTEVTYALTKLLPIAVAIIEKRAPNAPESIKDQAALLIVGYIFDRPTAAREGYGSILRSSGAGDLLLPWVAIRAKSTGGDTEAS